MPPRKKKQKRAKRSHKSQVRRETSVAEVQSGPPVGSESTAGPPEANPVSRRIFLGSRLKQLFTVSVLTLLVLAVGLVSGFWQARSGQRQADSTQESTDRSAGRLTAKTTVVELLPAAGQMLKLMKPLHPDFLDVKNGRPAEFIFFNDMHAICSVNPRVRLRNVGTEIVEAIDVEVEELSVMPFDWHKPPLALNPNQPGKLELLAHRPNLNPTVREKCALREKLRPGDDVEVPFWRPLLQAVLKAQKVKGLGIGDKYHGAFDVRCYARAVGTAAFDPTDGVPIPFGFMWSTKGFTDEMFITIADTPTLGTVKAASAGAR